MDKITYLAELAEGLARWVPERERQDILRYYAEYFEEAGPEREAQVVQELGDPWALSCRLAVEGGFVTQEQANSWMPPKKKRWPWVLVGVAAVFIFLVASVASMAAQVGRFVGHFVGQTPVETREPYAIIDSVEEIPGVTFIEGEDVLIENADAGGGFWSTEDGSLSPFNEIDLDVSIANVTVTAGDDYTLFINSNATLGGYSVKWEVRNGVLKIRDGGAAEHVEINSWEQFKNTFGINATALNVDITVPEGEVLGKLKIDTGLGDVLLTALRVEKVSVDSGLGDVQCYGCRNVRKLELDTGLGDLSLVQEELEDGVEIDLESGTGTIEATVGCAEKLWRYELEAGIGTVRVDGADRGHEAQRNAGGSFKLEAESGIGDIYVNFTGD